MIKVEGKGWVDKRRLFALFELLDEKGVDRLLLKPKIGAAKITSSDRV